ncbi:MAG TPA: hypothetical protein VM491_13150 [Burkholderiaceae bacterium]|nr:hypothetical protein [Burkholderiaceae bacterium]
MFVSFLKALAAATSRREQKTRLQPLPIAGGTSDARTAHRNPAARCASQRAHPCAPRKRGAAVNP